MSEFLEKSLTTRLNELRNIYFADDDVEMQVLWGNYLEEMLDPIGWQGIWTVTRRTCEKVKLLFPTTALILVKEVQYEDLTASVQILAFTDSIVLQDPSSSQVLSIGEICPIPVPLLEIFPTICQDETVPLNLMRSTCALDSLHYFYARLWHFWDVNISTKRLNHYFHSTLLRRLQLSMDANLPEGIIRLMKTWKITEELLTTQLEETEHFLDGLDDDDEDVSSKDLHLKLNNIHSILNRLELNFQLSENLEVRNLFFNKLLNTTSDADLDESRNVWVFADENLKLKDALEFAKESLVNHSELNFEIKYWLHLHIENISKVGIVLLCKREEKIMESIVLKQNATVKGLLESSIINMELNLPMFSISGTDVLLENLTLNLSSASDGIIIEENCSVQLINCTVDGSKSASSTQRGVIVSKGGKLTMNGSKIVNVSIGIYGESESYISLNNCCIENTNIGLYLNKMCNVDISNSAINSSSLCGICSEIQESDFEFNPYSSVKLENCTFNANNADKILNEKKRKLEGFNNIFSEKFWTFSNSPQNHPLNQGIVGT